MNLIPHSGVEFPPPVRDGDYNLKVLKKYTAIGIK